MYETIPCFVRDLQYGKWFQCLSNRICQFSVDGYKLIWLEFGGVEGELGCWVVVRRESFGWQ